MPSTTSGLNQPSRVKLSVAAEAEFVVEANAGPSCFEFHRRIVGDNAALAEKKVAGRAPIGSVVAVARAVVGLSVPAFRRGASSPPVGLP